MKWQYEFLELPSELNLEEAQTAMNALGDDGYELAMQIAGDDSIVLVFKKQK